jgi:hypothetical protein
MVFTIAKEQPNVHQWVNKQNVVPVYCGILFSFKKAGDSNARYNAGEP